MARGIGGIGNGGGRLLIGSSDGEGTPVVWTILEWTLYRWPHA